MDKKLSRRIKEFRSIVDAHGRKDANGIFVVPASISRLFVGVLEMDCGERESDAREAWNEYLNRLMMETAQ